MGAFNGLPKLEHLSMQRKEISEIRPGTFEKISHREYLSLAYNRIEPLVVDVFYGLVYLKDIFARKQTAIPPSRYVRRVTKSTKIIFIKNLWPSNTN